MNVPGGLATPASIRDMTAANTVLEASTGGSLVEQNPLPQADTWNFDWMMDIEMNDFSVLCHFRPFFGHCADIC